MPRNAAPSKPKQPKAKIGRPSIFTEELAAQICKTIASMPFSLKKLCAMNPSWPVDSTIICWTNESETFSSQYLEAKRRQIFTRMEYATTFLEEADINCKASVARAVAQVNLIKWEASHLLPKLFGDKPTEAEKPFTDSERLALRGVLAELVAKYERDY